MKGRISISEFIHKVKQELVEAQDHSGSPFFELTEVTLEVAFVLDASAKIGFDLWVAEIGGETKAQQTHKVTLKLTPLVEDTSADENPVEQSAGRDVETARTGAPAGGGGRGKRGKGGPYYAKIK